MHILYIHFARGPDKDVTSVTCTDTTASRREVTERTWTHTSCVQTPRPPALANTLDVCERVLPCLNTHTHTNMLRHTLAPQHACFPWQLCFFCLQHVRRLFGLINAAPRRRWSLTGSTCILPFVISPSPPYSCYDKQRYKRNPPPKKRTYLDSFGFNGFVNSIMKNVARLVWPRECSRWFLYRRQRC